MLNWKVPVWAAPSTRNCMTYATMLTGDSNSYTLEAAKGEFVSAQIFIRNTADLETDMEGEEYILRISGATVSKSSGGEFDCECVRVQAQEYISFADGVLHPDAISNGCKVDVLPNTTQSMWVTFPVSSDTQAGEYKFKIAFDSNFKEEISAEITLLVYNVTIPPTTEGAYYIEHFTMPEMQIIMDHGGYKCKVFDETWWKFMEEYARSLRESRSNVYRVSQLELLKAAGSKRIAKDKWYFDFTLFDKMVELLLKSGSVKKFCTNDLLAPWDKDEMFILDEQGEIVNISISDPQAEAWAKEYLTALYEHIVKFSRPEDWIVHIQDEPQVAEIWLWARERVRKYMPGLRCGNPFCAECIPQLGDNVELYIPVFWEVDMHPEFYQELAKKPGKEVWAYCCCSPAQSWFMQRFIERPAIQSRLIAWATYSQNFTGFLHYGYSYWQKTPQFYPFGIEKYSQYKGDCMLIYPSPEDNSYRISIRYINIRDGAQDYELLKIIEKADPEKAMSLSKRIATEYTKFDMDEKHFLSARHELLKLAEEAAIKK